MQATAPGDRRLCVRCRWLKDELEYEVILRRKPKRDFLDPVCRTCRSADPDWPRRDEG